MHDHRRQDNDLNGVKGNPRRRSSLNAKSTENSVAATAAAEVLHLAELVPIVRQRFAITIGFPDDAILASLKVIAAHSQERQRTKAAFASNLGQYLGRETADLQSDLRLLVTLLPAPRS